MVRPIAVGCTLRRLAGKRASIQVKQKLNRIECCCFLLQQKLSRIERCCFLMHDDGTLGKSVEEMVADFHTVKNLASEVGLDLNLSK